MIFSGSDDEFEQYFNELNDPLKTFPMDYLDYLNFPRSVTDSWMANQPRIKYIHCPTKTSSSLSPYIHIHLTSSS